MLPTLPPNCLLQHSSRLWQTAADKDLIPMTQPNDINQRRKQRVLTPYTTIPPLLPLLRLLHPSASYKLVVGGHTPPSQKGAAHLPAAYYDHPLNS